jgi:hypothetical protein
MSRLARTVVPGHPRHVTQRGKWPRVLLQVLRCSVLGLRTVEMLGRQECRRAVLVKARS